MPLEIPLNTTLTNEQFERLINTINDLGSFSVIDLVTLLIALSSLLVALAATVFTMHQRNIALRAEKQVFHAELLEILWYLKKYNGTIDSDCDIHFKRLQILSSASATIYSDEAKEFIDGLLDKIMKMPTLKRAYENEITPEAARFLESLGVDPNIHESLAIEYIDMKSYFNNDAFTAFKELFPVKA